jgi:predicted RNA-binding protein with PIN domain
MRWLVDGYNLMHAWGLLENGKELKPEPFRRVRRRFLKELAARLGPTESERTTVVFDANSPPVDLPLDSIQHRLRVLFALGDENADARIESLIAAHSSPKQLNVVSTDRRIRKAASRRKARCYTADDFLNVIEAPRPKRATTPFGRPDDRSPRPVISNPASSQSSQIPDSDSQEPELVSDDRDYWLAAFAELEELPEIREAFAKVDPLLSDAEIARIQREVDREFESHGKALPRRKPRG